MRDAQVLTVEEVAAALRVTPGIVRNACKRGEIRAMRIGKEWRIARSVLDDLLNN